MSSLMGSLSLSSAAGDHEPEDSMAAVDEVARLVLAFNQSTEDSSDTRLQALMFADGGCQKLLKAFRVECLQRPVGATDSEEGWSALDGAHRQFVRAYEKFLMSHLDAAEGGHAVGQLGTLAARLLFHIADVAKLSFFRAQPLETRLWQLAHQTYKFVELAGLEGRVIVLYDAPERLETTCRCVYARLLMLDTLVAGGLTPRQLELVDNWLGDWIEGEAIQREFTKGRFRYQVDLDGLIGASRLIEPPEADSLRFIDSESVCVQVERLRRSLRSGEVSGLLGLTGGFKGIEFVELLDRLERIWSLAWIGQDQREYRRERVENLALEVVRGLTELCRSARRDQRGGGTPDERATMSAAEAMDLKIYGFITERTRQRRAGGSDTESEFGHWSVFDRSVTGYGTVIAAGDERGLRAGSLLGLRLPGTRRWSVGVVARRIALRDTGEVFVGIEVLSATPVVVNIEPTGRELTVAGPLNIPAGRENQWALFLPGTQEHAGPDSLLIDSSMYSTARQFNLAARNVSYTIRMNRILGKGEGWQRVGFEVLAKRN